MHESGYPEKISEEHLHNNSLKVLSVPRQNQNYHDENQNYHDENECGFDLMIVTHKVSDQHLHHESQEILLCIITSLETVIRTKN
jgi:hypothetical protein